MKINKKEIKILIYRGYNAPEGVMKKENYQEFVVPFQERMTVLDVLNYVYERLDRSLSYYYSCRSGKCNGCIVNVDGRNKLACITFAEDGLKIGPAKGFKVIKDLLVDFSQKNH